MTYLDAGDGRSCQIAAFEDRLEAERAIDDLHQAGFSRQDIGFVLRGQDVGTGGMITDELGAGDGAGAVKGALTGGVVGGLIGAAAAMMVPGVGPVLAAGILSGVVGFGAAGVVTGGIIGAMASLGASEDEAHFYAREFDSGKALVAARVNDSTRALAREILKLHGGICAHEVGSAHVDVSDFRHEPM